MYPRVHEEPVIVAPSVYDYDDGYEIVDYDFYPSVSPYSMFRPYGGRRVRKRAGFDGFEPSLHVGGPGALVTGEVEDFGNEMDASSLSSRSHSPAYSFVSNYTFPDCDAPSPDDVHNGLWCAGYGMVFRSGLFASPRRITRHLDVLARRFSCSIARLRASLRLS